MRRKVILLLVLVIAFMAFSGCSNDTWQKRERIKELTGIEIPTDTDILYHYFDNSFGSGRHRQFTVHKFKNEPTKWLNENSFSDIKNTEMEQDFFEDEWIASTHGAEEIPNEYIPNFENTYYSLVKERVYFFYFPDTLMLVICVPGT